MSERFVGGGDWGSDGGRPEVMRVATGTQRRARAIARAGQKDRQRSLRRRRNKAAKHARKANR